MARRKVLPPAAAPRGEKAGPMAEPLHKALIVRTALDLLQSEGLDGISMRKIADLLGVKAAALYYHVKDKDELLAMLADRIGSETELPEEGLAWRESLRQWAVRFREALGRYRDSAAVMNATLVSGESRLTHAEFLFRTLSEAGFEDADVPWLAAMLKNYVLGFADEERRLAERARGDEASLSELETEQSDRFRALSPERYPHMIRLAAYTVSTDWDREFAFGLGVLLDGFEARLSGRR
ncbi:TetR/AcrR family transcriptional regulator C-terminal domain-containing protein [Cohnella xylanilytica]|uniref:TetR/AcrR family transcriptional regulator C-terminal domain-containing protein n=1 Tax=Cohnella xylanilytica TaxID=557555 RepID=UPI001BB3F50A|nr:TetR/AcrR family transcriptional regulator C-terminal domain-containing protein [Cohnella xylanilytica]